MKALLLVCLATGSAAAETPVPPKTKQPDPPPAPSTPDPIVDDTENVNLESTARHQGLNLTFAIGGGLTVGFGIDNAVGRGGSGSLRVAEAASSRIAFTFELATLQLPHQIKAMGDSPIKLDHDTNLLGGVQFYANRTLWLRLAGGIGVYQQADVDSALRGPVAAVGGGFDLVRTRRLAVGLEFMTTAMINRDGMLSTTAFMVDLQLE